MKYILISVIDRERERLLYSEVVVHIEAKKVA